MTSRKKQVALLSALAVTAAFSTVSISTVYFTEARTSGLDCQQTSTSKASLTYVSKGIVNQSRNKLGQAACPVAVSTAVSNTVNTIVSNDASLDQTVQCDLIEIDGLSGNVLATYPNSTRVGGRSTSLVTWFDVETSTDQSNYTVSCSLPAGTGIIGTSVSVSPPGTTASALPAGC